MRTRGEQTVAQKLGGLAMAGAVLMAGLSLATPLAAQTLLGRVADGESRQPLADAQLTLLHPDGSPLAEPMTSGQDGTFSIPIPGRGEYFIRVERTSYTPIVDGIFEFTSTEGMLEIEIYLVRQPIQLEGFTAEAERRQIRRNLRSQGFYQRAEAGFGDFIGPEEIEQRAATNTSDFLRRIPGIITQGGEVRFNTPSASSRSPTDRGSTNCEPYVWIDGVRLGRADDTDFERANEIFGLDNRIEPSEVIAIEVYRRPSSTPLQWSGTGTSCGAIVIWTRGGSGG